MQLVRGTTAIGGSAALSGTLGGRTLDVVDPFAAKGVDDPTNPERVTVILADLPNLCSFLRTATAANETKANLFDLLIVLGGSTSAHAWTHFRAHAGARVESEALRERA